MVVFSQEVSKCKMFLSLVRHGLNIRKIIYKAGMKKFRI